MTNKQGRTTVALAQVGSTDDKQVNLRKAKEFLRLAADRGAELTVFPEVFMSHFPENTPIDVVRQDAEQLDGPFVSSMRDSAVQYRQWVVFGMRETPADEADLRVYNTTVVINSFGDIAGVYRKTHLYDAFGARESEKILPGNELFDPIDTPFGRLGLFVCYELRFPEVARIQAIRGADLIVVPSGWVRGPLKELHWETLVTARALENSVYLLACDQVSQYYCGRSMVVDPMGVIVACGGESEQLVVCDIDLERIRQVRTKLPSHRQRRAELYGSITG
jgi:predicted amidohydrolase